jgi:hypothetical protein
LHDDRAMVGRRSLKKNKWAQKGLLFSNVTYKLCENEIIDFSLQCSVQYPVLDMHYTAWIS